jgi:hypothetical protein
MGNMIPRVRRAVVAALLLSGAVAAGRADAAQGGASSGSDLKGTWRVQVSLVDCGNGAPVGPTFRSMLTFGDGTVSGTTINGSFQPGQLTPTLGSWKATGNRTYVAVSEAFILFTSAPSPPAPGFQRGTQRITQSIKLGRNTFSSAAVTEYFDVNGDRVASGCASALATRLQ